jgi:CelD/BcsL family acetyltransferase involved in cellulose biosynthesis
LRVEIVDSFKGLLELRSEWLALEAASGANLPFQTWEWAVAWWCHLHEERPGVRDSLRICVVRDALGEQVAGIAPLMLTERPSTGPVRARYLQFLGADPNITEIRTMLSLPELEYACGKALYEYLGQFADTWDWIAWEAPGSPTAESSPWPICGDGKQKSAYVLELPSTWDELKGRLKRNIKQSLRKCHNSLQQDGLTYAVEIASEQALMGAALEPFFQLHAARANLPGAPTHANVFGSSQTRTFLRELCEQLAERDVTRIFSLRIGDTVVAARIAFELSGVLYLYYSGWDSAYGGYSIMTTLVAEMIQYAIRRGLRAVHLSTGTDVSKTRWGPVEHSYVSGISVSPRATAYAMRFAYRSMVRLAQSDLARALAPQLIRRGTNATAAASDRDAPVWDVARSPR